MFLLALYSVFKAQHDPSDRFICTMNSSLQILHIFRMSGDGETRTHDPLLARQVLSQLSYTPMISGSHLLSHAVARIVPWAAQVLTVVFGMGTGVSPGRIATGCFFLYFLSQESRFSFAACRPLHSQCFAFAHGLPASYKSLFDLMSFQASLRT